eukprot:11137753-Lingulodinium_polyedra.AAC.1
MKMTGMASSTTDISIFLSRQHGGPPSFVSGQSCWRPSLSVLPWATVLDALQPKAAGAVQRWPPPVPCRPAANQQGTSRPRRRRPCCPASWLS